MQTLPFVLISYSATDAEQEAPVTEAKSLCHSSTPGELESSHQVIITFAFEKKNTCISELIISLMKDYAQMFWTL